LTAFQQKRFFMFINSFRIHINLTSPDRGGL
jgi:hypothetical protein